MTAALPPPFPLVWPAGWPRTREPRLVPRFDDRHERALGAVERELRLLGASDYRVTSDLPTRIDGKPYATARADDPGISVYWLQRVRGEVLVRVMACDRWRSVGGNIRAIALSISALRGLERWGTSAIVERAFAGFAALPPAPPIETWRDVFALDDRFAGFDAPDLLAVVRARFRVLSRDAHPDSGGSTDAMARLNAAMDAAERELGDG